jgi:hypothetical protein
MTPPGIETATFRFVAEYLNHCATISGPHISESSWFYYKDYSSSLMSKVQNTKTLSNKYNTLLCFIVLYCIVLYCIRRE